MTPLHEVPPLRDVVREQLRAVGIALRREAILAAVLVAIATVGVGAIVLRDGAAFDFHPERTLLPGLLGLFLPIVVWKGEERFGGGFLWTLPVDHRRHALAKTFAGWVWLMAAVAFAVLWLLAMAIVSGDQLIGAETVRLLTAGAGTKALVWTPSPILWLVPFTAATAMYLLGSALMVGTAHPVRWVAGSVLALLLIHTAGVATSVQWLQTAPFQAVKTLFCGEYGLDALLSARTESLTIEATLPGGERVTAWRALPEVRTWALATLLWSGAGLAALWIAATRRRDRS